MQQTSGRRITRVMFYGIDADDMFLHHKLMVKGGLQTMHMGWTLLAHPRNTPAEAIADIKEFEDLEVVYFLRCIESKDAVEIALALAEHKHKPWVHLVSESDYLKPIFEKLGVKVRDAGPIEHTIHERWASQIARSKAFG